MSENTISLNKTNTSTVKKMIGSGKSFSQVQNAMVALDMVPSAKDAETYLKSVGFEKGKRRGLQNEMYAFLQEAPRTQDELYRWIKENGSENTWRWRKQHDKVRELTVRLHVNLSGVKFEEKAYAEPKKEAA